MTETDRLKHDSVVRYLIARHGWAILHEDQPGGPCTYTVGLTEKGIPELVVYGLLHVVAENILNTLGEQLVAGIAVPANAPVDGILERYPLMLIDVADSSAALPVANRFYRLDVPVHARQVLFPDTEGRFPWEPGSLLAGMPILGDLRA